ncbi:2-oxoglutarate dehydrogenase complex E2 component [Agyrium rufum]|nr:2-oxoglutarate dehydrogenase complex E2 component [Agyrium rufum]
MAESISEGTLKQFSKKIGDHVEQDEELATIETDKIDVSVNAPEAGIVKEFLANEDDTVTVGQDLIKLEPGEGGTGGAQEASQEPQKPATDEQPTSSDPKPKKTPSESQEKQAAPRKSEEQESPAPQPKPSTPKPAESTPSNAQQQSSSKPSSPLEEKAKPATQASQPFGSRDERRVKMNRMRLRISERLKQSQNTAASLTTFNEVDMSSIMEFRKLYKDEILKKNGVKLGFMSAFSKACILAMKDIPAVNASIEGPGGGDTIVYRDYVDISVAVATEKGLVTPVVRNAESMSMIEIEKAIADLGKKASEQP